MKSLYLCVFFLTACSPSPSGPSPDERNLIVPDERNVMLEAPKQQRPAVKPRPLPNEAARSDQKLDELEGELKWLTHRSESRAIH